MSTTDEWHQILVETVAHEQGTADRILAMLASLQEATVGFAVNQLVHSLQTATRAEEAGAEILRPYVSDDTFHMVLVHQDFQGRHYYEYIGHDPNAREKYEGQPWFALAQQFADEWDQTSFDPDYPTQPLSHFEPMAREVFGTLRAA